jgi:hypothetical protein
MVSRGGLKREQNPDALTFDTNEVGDILGNAFSMIWKNEIFLASGSKKDLIRHPTRAPYL